MSNIKDIPFNIDCTGDCCVGDIVKFERATFSGKYPNVKFAGNELIVGKIIKDSYGKDKQQHTFTLELYNGDTLRIKGRNLYRNGVQRQKWDNEEERKISLLDKHHRGSIARKKKQFKKLEILNYE